jgi:hypothetical protein
MGVRTLALGDDPNQVCQDLNAAFDGTTQTDLKAKSLSGGTVSATTGSFTTISASGQVTSTVVTGTAPLVVASTTEVANLKAATATLADAAKGDTRFQLSAGHPQINTDENGRFIGSIARNIPAGKSFKLYRANYYSLNSVCKFKVTPYAESAYKPPWYSNSPTGDETPNFTLYTNSTGITQLCIIHPTIYRFSGSGAIDTACGFWFDLVIE